MLRLDHFLALVDAYKRATKLADATISTKVLNDGQRIETIRNGGDIGARRLERAIEWFDQNWPVDADWPRTVPRPSINLRAAS